MKSIKIAVFKNNGSFFDLDSYFLEGEEFIKFLKENTKNSGREITISSPEGYNLFVTCEKED